MARLPELRKLAKLHNMKFVSIADLIAYRLEHESLIERTAEVELNTAWDFHSHQLSTNHQRRRPLGNGNG